MPHKRENVKNKNRNGNKKPILPDSLALRTAGIICMLLALVCLCMPASVFAAEGRGVARLTGYAPLYLPSVVNITVQATPESYGTASGGGTGITPGEEVTVTAQPNEGYYFTGWFEDSRLLSDQATYTFRADRDLHLIASFGDLATAGSNPNANTQGAGGDANANAQGAGGDSNANTPAGGAPGSSGSGAPGSPGSGTPGSQGNANAGSNAPSAPSTSPSTGSAAPYVPHANSNDMPTTGVGDMYRIPVIIVLMLFGTIAVLISIPAGRHKKH